MPNDNPVPQTPVSNAPAEPTTAELIAALEANQAKTSQAIGQWSEQIVKAVSARPAPTEPAKPAPKVDPNDDLTALASGDWSPVERRAQAIAERAMKDTLGPYFQQELPDRANANETAAREAIDAEFGKGTFDEVIKPGIDSGFGENVAQKAIATQYKNALDVVKGRNFQTLVDRRSAHQAAQAKAKEEAQAQVKAPFMPGPGFEFVEENELSERDREMVGKMRAARLPNVPDDETLAKLRDLMSSQGTDGVSIEQFNELLPAKS